MHRIWSCFKAHRQVAQRAAYEALLDIRLISRDASRSHSTESTDVTFIKGSRGLCIRYLQWQPPRWGCHCRNVHDAKMQSNGTQLCHEDQRKTLQNQSWFHNLKKKIAKSSWKYIVLTGMVIIKGSYVRGLLQMSLARWTCSDGPIWGRKNMLLLLLAFWGWFRRPLTD